MSNPEFLREGTGVHDSLEPDRLLVGADDAEGFEAMRRLYAPLLERGVRLIETDVATAELSKHASNAFLALKISYANALARICELVGADVDAVTHVMGSDPRIGPAFLGAGLGYGGYCFPKDVAAFERLAERLGYPFPMLAEVARINDEAVQAVVERLRDEVRELSGSRVAVLGLSFKPETDDVRLRRRSPSRAGSSSSGQRWSGSTPERERTPRPSSRSSGSRPIRTTRRPERTRSCSPPTGPSSATSISPASGTR